VWRGGRHGDKASTAFVKRFGFGESQRATPAGGCCTSRQKDCVVALRARKIPTVPAVFCRAKHKNKKSELEVASCVEVNTRNYSLRGNCSTL